MDTNKYTNSNTQSTNPLRTVLTVSGGAGTGKTATLRSFANLVISTYPNSVAIQPIPTGVPNTGDFRFVARINGRVIGIESCGDPGTGLAQRLIDLADNYHCELIVCASRTRGETVLAVEEELRKQRGFETIWTSTYLKANPAQHHSLNNMKARHMLDLLQGLSLI